MIVLDPVEKLVDFVAHVGVIGADKEAGLVRIGQHIRSPIRSDHRAVEGGCAASLLAPSALPGLRRLATSAGVAFVGPLFRQPVRT